MFHNKDEKKEEVSVVPENTLMSKDKEMHHTLEQMSKMADEDICPVIFHDEDVDPCTQHAELMFVNANLQAMKYNLPELPYKYLNGFSQASANVFDKVIIDRIKEESLLTLLTVLDMLDSEHDNFFLKYFHIRETLEAKIRESNLIDKTAREFRYCSPYSMTDLSQEALDATRTCCDVMVNLIFSAIVAVVSDAVNCAIDDTVMRVHMIPNIMKFEDDIIKMYNPPKEDINSPKFWLYADCTIKNTVIGAFHTLAFKSIFINLMSIIETSHETSYFIYRDATDDKCKKEFGDEVEDDKF